MFEAMPIFFSREDKINFLLMSRPSLHIGPDPYDGMGLAWRAVFENMASKARITEFFVLGEFNDTLIQFRAVCRTAKFASARVWYRCICWFVRQRGDALTLP